tara:strand:+ start:156 stop:920 length:765 start_codon:yes stop_codon:yes gene_type:complete
MEKENPFNLSGKVALITGASSGLGKHFAKTLSSNGAKTILAARRVEKMEKFQGELKNKSFIVDLDVTSKESVNNLKEKIENTIGQLDIVINNAGISDPVKFKDISEDSWLSILETNLNGAFRIAKMATDIMLKNKNGGSIINIASILAERVGLNLASYASAKAALVQLTKSMALELARSNIRVNALAPGYILTEINQDFFDTKEGQGYINKIPMKRLGFESELDGALLLLASDASSFMTGSVITVDGGHVINPL